MEVGEALPAYKRYTYDDYCSWDDDKRRELIDGIPHAMSAPTIRHQEVSSSLHNLLYNFLKGKPCKVFAAPVDVRLNADSYDDTVVQPDILVVCDRSKLNDRCCVGAPDLVAEILSPSTLVLDKITKHRLYLRTSVREYWIVDPEGKTVSVNILKNGEYATRAYSVSDSVPVHVLDGCVIDLSEVFAE